MKRGLPMFEAPHVTITTPGFKALTLSMSVVTDDPTELLVKDLGDTKAELTQHGRAFCSSGMIRDGAAWRCVTMGPMSLTNRQLIPCWTPHDGRVGLTSLLKCSTFWNDEAAQKLCQKITLPRRKGKESDNLKDYTQRLKRAENNLHRFGTSEAIKTENANAVSFQCVLMAYRIDPEFGPILPNGRPWIDDYDPEDSIYGYDQILAAAKAYDTFGFLPECDRFKENNPHAH